MVLALATISGLMVEPTHDFDGPYTTMLRAVNTLPDGLYGKEQLRRKLNVNEHLLLPDKIRLGVGLSRLDNPVGYALLDFMKPPSTK